MKEVKKIQELRDLHITATALLDNYLHLVNKEKRQSTKMREYQIINNTTPPSWSVDLMQIRRDEKRVLRSFEVIAKEIKEKSLPFKVA